MTYKDVRSRSLTRPVALVAAVSMLLLGAGTATAALAAPVASVVPAAAHSAPPLANLDHLNFLLDTVPLAEVPGHTTYQLDSKPTAQAPWTYADKKPDGSYGRVGGGSLDPATGYWSQGAYNADDIARTAVVYLRHWQQTGDAGSREHAFETLRSLTYLQTASGPNAGNVILWQQADGTLTPSATPKELPDPSDSAESYWVARTVWALGEGYAAFKDADPDFAAFLQDRLHLSLDSLNRQSLGKYGTFDVADGVQVPAWLIAGGADASAEAVLGLSAYARVAPGDNLAATALTRLAEGVAGMSSGSVNQWPYGAMLPWNKSQTLWHAWGGMAPAAVATAADVLGRGDLLTAAIKDAAQFTPQLLAAGGPDNAWTPTPGEAQIAYGVDSRLQGLVATAKAAKAPGLLDVAAITAGWYFGANRSGAPAYDPTSGTTVDGIEYDGRVNHNSGAESTIHALLSMLVLDANPALKAKALGIDETVATKGLSVVEAESGAVSGAGSVVTPPSAWTGEANWSKGAYVALGAGGSVSIPVPAADQARNVYPIVNQAVTPAGATRWAAGTTALGSTPNGGAGEQGITDAPGKLFPFSLARTLSAGATSVVGTSDGDAALDALLIQPLVSTVSVTGSAGDSTLYVSAATVSSVRTVVVPKGYKLVQRAYDSSGRLVPTRGDTLTSAGRVTIAAGGFTVATLVRK
ncbi:hypothetical protein [Cryobacterium tagatosivorans]|uniref:Uncharacterized protein n=1 Tax=Cryobacterium tagatosivorans TaxID=1259199 RepID=A0A4R8UEV1_9MICO|nr:hypothetical protein [Cryobacterium tagatosivorans]TFB49892.1 hypothetical protein E3O23_10885 [Cryobacterium tagatosivorans]